LLKNAVPLDWITGKDCLDAGCGGGRYAMSLARIGAKRVTGVDAASASIRDAERRCESIGYSSGEFLVGDVLDLPLPDDRFDFVMSYGVLHHTTDPKRGIRECYRVLKPGGNLLIFLMSGTGLVYDCLNVLREVLKTVSPSITKATMQLMGYPPNRVFNMVDLFHVPIHARFSPDEVERTLRESGFVNIRRLERDVSTPHWTHYNEQIYQRTAYAELKYGTGDNKYVAQKR
jgi:ubiquinone/menaquinone biosynthesis C-methylase UbiE